MLLFRYFFMTLKYIGHERNVPLAIERSNFTPCSIKIIYFGLNCNLDLFTLFTKNLGMKTASYFNLILIQKNNNKRLVCCYTKNMIISN